MLKIHTLKVFECVECVNFFIPFDMCLCVSICFSIMVSILGGWMRRNKRGIHRYRTCSINSLFYLFNLDCPITRSILRIIFDQCNTREKGVGKQALISVWLSQFTLRNMKKKCPFSAMPGHVCYLGKWKHCSCVSKAFHSSYTGPENGCISEDGELCQPLQFSSKFRFPSATMWNALLTARWLQLSLQ